MSALKVRIRERRRPKPPEFLYQNLPPEGAALLATLPAAPAREELAVSIPAGKSSWRGGWSLSAEPPDVNFDGLVVIYRLQTDCRYTAIAVRTGGRDYAPEDFVDIARRRLKDQFGNLEKIPSRYIYAAPDKEEWGSILRDGGYVALNPEKNLTLDNTTVLLPGEAERYGNDIMIRAQLYSGDKLSGRNPIPVFTRVEVLTRIATRATDGEESLWIDFEEYRKTRDELAVVPAAIAAEFGEWLAAMTKESGFDVWRFRPGMAFGEQTEWWGLRGRRRTVHEGLDFVEGFRGGEVNLIPEGVPARAIASGEVTATLDDFMGKTVVVRHNSLISPDGKVFHTLFSHIQTEGTLPSFVMKGEILGRVGKRAGIRIRPHLHLTGAWFPDGFPFAQAGIDTIMHPGFTPVILANINNLIETSPLCVTAPDDKEFLIDD